MMIPTAPCVVVELVVINTTQGFAIIKLDGTIGFGSLLLVLGLTDGALSPGSGDGCVLLCVCELILVVCNWTAPWWKQF